MSKVEFALCPGVNVITGGPNIDIYLPDISLDNVLLFPERQFHPAQMMEIADFINKAAVGRQIVVTTYSYLLMFTLSLFVEYNKNLTTYRFFSLYKENGIVKVETGNTLVDIDNNSVLDAHAAHYDYESELFCEVQK